MFQQLTDALLAMEEEKAIWSAIEKTSIQAIEEKSNSYSAKISFLSSEMSQVLFFKLLPAVIVEECLHFISQFVDIQRAPSFSFLDGIIVEAGHIIKKK